jgi:hypothetical protein
MDPARVEPVRAATAVRYPTSGGGILRYALMRRDSIVATMPTGEGQMQLLGRTAFVTISWIAADTGTRVTTQVDSVIADSGLTSYTASLDSARGLRWTALRLPDGHLINVSTGRGSLVGDQIRDQVHLLFPVLPAAGARPGESWSDSTTRPTRVSAFEASETALSSSVAAGTLTRASLLEIATVRMRRASGEGTQFNQPMTVQASGTDTLTYRLAQDGRVMEVAGNRNTDLIVQLPSIGQSVPAHESSSFRMTLLR